MPCAQTSFPLPLQTNEGIACSIFILSKPQHFISSIFYKMAQEFTDSNFKAEILDSNQVAVIDLWAPWCGPCKMMTPIVDDLSKEYEGKAIVGKLNVDDNPNVPMEYGVRGIPTFLIFKGGELKEKVVGTQTKEALKNRIEALLSA
jgi:thioredoxin 1